MATDSSSSDSDFLTAEERTHLRNSEQLDIGVYRAWGAKGKDCAFVVELDARPLAVLIEEASRGLRVFEFMTIARPGDLLNYLYLRFIDVEDEVIKRVEKSIKDRDWHLNASKSELLREMPFAWFDGTFSWQGDDTEPYAEKWLLHREGQYWKQKLGSLFQLTHAIQDRLRHLPDYLVRHEIALMDQKRHRRDYWVFNKRMAELKVLSPRETNLPQALFDLIVTLAQSKKVNSVSCPFTDYHLWRMLVAEQVRRSEKAGLSPQEVFRLSGPDSGLGFNASDWGGEIHIPYEGAADGDLFIKPGWRKLFPELADRGGGLRHVVYGAGCRAPCCYVLSGDDYGEIESASRTVVGDWFLYEAMEVS